jgi:hypothetical protein
VSVYLRKLLCVTDNGVKKIQYACRMYHKMLNTIRYLIVCINIIKMIKIENVSTSEFSHMCEALKLL